MKKIFSFLVIVLALSRTSIYAVGDEEDQLLNTNSCVNCDLKNAWSEKANLRKADLSGANLYRANMEYTDLRDARVSNTKTDDIRF